MNELVKITQMKAVGMLLMPGNYTPSWKWIANLLIG